MTTVIKTLHSLLPCLTLTRHASLRMHTGMLYVVVDLGTVRKACPRGDQTALSAGIVRLLQLEGSGGCSASSGTRFVHEVCGLERVRVRHQKRDRTRGCVPSPVLSCMLVHCKI